MLACPAGRFNFTQHHVSGLPPVDFTPVRAPPKGRKQTYDKRQRSESNSPETVLKSSRIVSPTPAIATDNLAAVNTGMPTVSGAASSSTSHTTNSISSEFSATAKKLLAQFQQSKEPLVQEPLN